MWRTYIRLKISIVAQHLTSHFASRTHGSLVPALAQSTTQGSTPVELADVAMHLTIIQPHHHLDVRTLPLHGVTLGRPTCRRRRRASIIRSGSVALGRFTCQIRQGITQLHPSSTSHIAAPTSHRIPQDSLIRYLIYPRHVIINTINVFPQDHC